MLSATAAQRVNDVEEILSLTKKEGVALEPKKCDFFKQNLDYTGRTIFPGKLAAAGAPAK